MQAVLQRLAVNEDGQGMAEYGLILALIAVVCITAFTGLGTAIKDYITNLASNF